MRCLICRDKGVVLNCYKSEKCVCKDGSLLDERQEKNDEQQNCVENTKKQKRKKN